MKPQVESKKSDDSRGGSLSAPSPQFATRVGNGRAVYFDDERIDQRSLSARRFRELLAAFANDISAGAPETLTEAQRQLCRRAAQISVELERYEAVAAERGSMSEQRLEIYGVMSDRLGRCLERLGLERKLRDVTPRPNAATRRALAAMGEVADD
jgi:hypothetical protein